MKHGAELRALGFNISQVVHDYGDICQAVTEVAVESRSHHHPGIPRAEPLPRYRHRRAVTEHSRITAEQRSTGEIERSGQLAHEVRDQLNTALLAFHTLKGGTVAINGSTGTVLGRSLINLRDLVDSTLSDIRMSANIAREERIPIGVFLDEIALAANLHAEFREVRLRIRGRSAACRQRRSAAAGVGADESAEQRLQVHPCRRARLAAGGGRRRPGAHRSGRPVRWDGRDQRRSVPAVYRSPKIRSQRDGTRAVDCPQGRANTWRYIKFRNLPGRGCVFTIELPLATETPAPYNVVPPADASL